MQNNQATKHNKGFILLPVVLTLAILAAIAYLLSRESAINVGNVNREQQQDIALYAAQAGYHHVRWQLNQQNCTGYTDIPATTFGNQSYLATITDETGTTLTAGSPVNIQVTSTLASGANYTIRHFREKVYQNATVTLQLGTDPGKDAVLSNILQNKNYGNYKQSITDITLFSTQTHQLIQFDLSSIATSTQIISARLELKQKTTVQAGTNSEISVYRVKQAWVEGTQDGSGLTPDGATWKTTDGSQTWDDGAGGSALGGAYDTTAISSIMITSDNVLRKWDVTALVQGWQTGQYNNDGLLLKSSGSDKVSITLASKEDSTAADRPKLIITYLCECGLSC